MTGRADVLVPFVVFPSRKTVLSLCEELGLPAPRVAERDGVLVIRWGDGPKLTLTHLTPDSDGQTDRITALAGRCWERLPSEALFARVVMTESLWKARCHPDWDAEGYAQRFLRGWPEVTGGLTYLSGVGLFDESRDCLTSLPEPPAAERVARRALVLLALGARGFMDTAASDGPKERAYAARHCDGLRAWLVDRPEVSYEMEECEVRLVNRELGGLPREDAFDAVDQAEGAQVLLWALGRRELPSFTESHHPQKAAEAHGVQGSKRPELLRQPTMRSAKEVAAARRLFLAVYWRLVGHRSFPSRPYDLRAKARARESSFDIGRIPLVDGDLALAGVPIAEAPREVTEEAERIAREHYRAANWLLGCHPRYHLVATPTTWPPARASSDTAARHEHVR